MIPTVAGESAKYFRRLHKAINQSDHNRHLDQRPITAAKAGLLSIPNVATATAIASSKLFEAAVNDSVAHCGYVAPTRLLSANDTTNMIPK
jgi:hypothetical protein